MLQSRYIEWLNGYTHKKYLPICCLQETHFKSEDTYRLKESKGMEKSTPSKRKLKETWDSNPYIIQNGL